MISVDGPLAAAPPARRSQRETDLFDPRDGIVPASTVSALFEVSEDEPPGVRPDALGYDDGIRDPSVPMAEAPHHRRLRVS